MLPNNLKMWWWCVERGITVVFRVGNYGSGPVAVSLDRLFMAISVDLWAWITVYWGQNRREYTIYIPYFAYISPSFYNL
jgi:hypothetical protein